ncbi:hypothetical protein TNCV_1868881 [Trichonephila clavipes]|nr:hypothetical protein TNCV_1868881 [Trichonephila clavipes]
MQQADILREPMNLKPTYIINLFSTESSTTAGVTQTREPNPWEDLGAGCCFSSQFRAITGGSDQHFFSPSVWVWGKLVKKVGIEVIVVFPYNAVNVLNVNVHR